MAFTSNSRSSTKGFVAERISKSATILLDGLIDEVFPLFTPIKEKEWVEGWNPNIVYSESDVEERMVFRTAPRFQEEENYTWILTQYNSHQYQIEYTVTTADRIWFVRVECKQQKARTEATITYTYTGLSEKGVLYNQEALKKMYTHDLKDWEKAINYHLKTGQKLIDKPHNDGTT